MTTLFDVLRKTYLALGQMEISTATGGSVSTIIDTKIGDKYGDGDIVGSSVFIIRDAGGAGSAPEKEISFVSDYVASTNTITVSPSYTTAVAAGDKYGIAKNIVDYYTMIEIVNDALQSLGTIQLTDISMTTLENVTEYSLPISLKYRVTGVQIQTNDEVDNYEFNDIFGYYIVNSAAGSTAMLCFNNPLPAGNILKIFYEAEHPKLNEPTDVVSETIHSEYATKLIVDKALEYQIRRTNGTDPFLIQTQNKAMADVQEAKSKFSQSKRKRPKYITPYSFKTEED